MTAPAREITGHTVILRLVEEDDADYIWGLRQDPRYNAHLSQAGGTAEDQRAWIAAYKTREAEGTEYYFVILRADDRRRCGTVRLYGIAGGQFTWGSWILDENKPAKAALDSALQVYRYGFEELGLEKSVFDVRHENTHTLSFHDRFGGRRIGSDAANVYYELPRETFEALEAKYARVFG